MSFGWPNSIEKISRHICLSYVMHFGHAYNNMCMCAGPIIVFGFIKIKPTGCMYVQHVRSIIPSSNLNSRNHKCTHTHTRARYTCIAFNALVDILCATLYAVVVIFVFIFKNINIISQKKKKENCITDCSATAELILRFVFGHFVIRFWLESDCTAAL